MSDATGTKRKREASSEDFQRLLGRLSPDSGEAWQAYDALRRKLVMFFEYHCRSQAEELAEEVLDRIAKKSDSYEISNVSEFAFGVARNLRKEVSRKSLLVRMAHAAAPGELSGTIQHPEDVIVNKIDSERRLECFLKCMRRLDAEDRKLLFEYYPLEDDELDERRAKLAEKHQVSIGTLRTRMVRLREKMERCFENCCANRKGPRSTNKVRL